MALLIAFRLSAASSVGIWRDMISHHRSATSWIVTGVSMSSTAISFKPNVRVELDSHDILWAAPAVRKAVVLWSFVEGESLHDAVYRCIVLVRFEVRRDESKQANTMLAITSSQAIIFDCCRFRGRRRCRRDG
ncbi:hypothetical protein B0T10DRAFT_460140 [Thelonectria olida]|uniref:Uncharacterized protein n=1 Tax=Thelonectria olida TaxID=1576542 RepID=A0A9P8W3S3_9HYPO|nr:hypothetical protein B0T10DRAFT_460140 [Thelonectria olida]